MATMQLLGVTQACLDCAFGDCLIPEDEFELKCNEDIFMPRSKVHYKSGDSRTLVLIVKSLKLDNSL